MPSWREWLVFGVLALALWGYGIDSHAQGLVADARASVARLPDNQPPWWPSRYGADDQLGTLNEITRNNFV